MTIDQLREVFLWCMVFNLVFILVSSLAFLALHDFICRMHRKWFKIPAEKIDAIVYASLAFYKICILCFNVAPYIALCIVK